MKYFPSFRRFPVAASVAMFSASVFAQSTPAPADKPYKILATTKIPATGGIDYVNADSAARRVYVACGNTVSVFDLDTYKLVGSLPNASGHGVALDPENHTGLVSGNPAVFFNTQTLQPIKTIPTPRADGYIFDPLTHHFFILTHGDPNLYVIDSKDGSLVTTIPHLGKDDTAGAIEQGATDGQGHLYFDVENQGCIAVVDAKTLQVTGHYDLGEKGGGNAGLAIDPKNHILFAMCRGGNGTGPTCVILSATDGKIITTLPLAGGSDGGGFNPGTMEAFSSTGNDGKGSGALSIIKENSPTDFVLEDTVVTKSGAKTCTLDAKTGNIITITEEALPTPAPAAGSATAASTSAPAASAASATPAASAAASGQVAAATPPADSAGGRGGRGGRGPQQLDVIFVGR